MKRNSKKGFTIVELVIVIAVIAILAGVLIPTFASITKNAKESKALQEAQNAIKVMVAEYAEDGKTITEATVYCYDKNVATAGAKVEYTVKYANGVAEKPVEANALENYNASYTYYANGEVVVKADDTSTTDDDSVKATVLVDLANNIIVVVKGTK